MRDVTFREVAAAWSGFALGVSFMLILYFFMWDCR